ncbi:histone-lysine N-methyltransferase SETDB2 [Chanos chanos]|uniref:Histone-lysine N-methyltransferase SETDB2 n=1 Tax=Chanos chanos TaxID=29144 RepID=A0A6J2VUH3_CHACN|nr:histone-lysine N-methyltransferase SETDB2 [Chanos chanos]
MEEEVERAKHFWTQVDIDEAFNELWEYLAHLKQSIKDNSASDKEYVQGMNILLESEVTLSLSLRNEFIEEVLIGEDIMTVSVSDSLLKGTESSTLEATADAVTEEEQNPRHLKSLKSNNNETTPQKIRKDVLSPVTHDPVSVLTPFVLNYEEISSLLSPNERSYQEHNCSSACLSDLPPHADYFLGHNPLRVPMLCHFQRCCTKLRPSSKQELVAQVEVPDCLEADILYRAPCGRSLHCLEEVLSYLRQTGSLGVLQLENFSFNPLVLPERQTQAPLLGAAPPQAGAVLFERDISRGTEAVPIPLCNEVDGVRPRDFRYRKERWPHGYFLSSHPLFSVCCDCKDGCVDDQTCSCLQQSLKAGADPTKLYTHLRLNEAVPTGLYECGPWCGCERNRCQNRVVQRGLRVRLQVYRTHNKGWGVRCRDDLDKGTFVCTYAGVVHSSGRSLDEILPSKSKKEEPVSDDEVEVVDEWTFPMSEKETVAEQLDSSPRLHVPVIQRSADLPSHVLDGEKEQTENIKDLQEPSDSSPLESKKTEDEGEIETKKAKLELNETQKNKISGERTGTRQTLPKLGSQDHLYYLDATQEGNVGRFINHSCSPNLFVQNVFVDTHDPRFPAIAFFTSRPVKAGTELTWNYSCNPGSDPKHEVQCQCGSKNCQRFLI